MKQKFLILLVLIFGAFLWGEDISIPQAYINRPVREVFISGNIIFSDEYIFQTAGTELCPGLPLNPLLLQEDMKKIMKLGSFQRVGVDCFAADTGIIVVYMVEENPLLNKITFRDNVSFSAERLKRLLKNKEHEQLNYRFLDEDIARINRLYKENNFDISSVTEAKFLEPDELLFAVSEPRVEDIIITGNIFTDTELIRREFSLQRGSVFNGKTLQEDRSRIFSLGYFSQVSLPEITPSREPGRVDIKIMVTEKKKNNLNFGLGVSSGEEFGFMRLSLLNIFNTGEQMYFNVQTGQEYKRSKLNYSFRYYNPWVFQRNLSFGFTRYLKFGYESMRTAAEIEDILNIRRDGFSTDLGFPLPFGRQYRFIFEYKEELVREAEDYPQVDYFNKSLAGTYIYDGLETSGEGAIIIGGEMLKLRYEKGGLLQMGEYTLFNLGGVNFARIDMVYDRFLPLDQKSTIGFRYKSGVFESDRQRNILEGEEYSVGGGNTVRGYPDSDPFAIGPKLTLVNLEYRYLFHPQWQGVLFYDWGDAYSDINTSIKDFKSGYGFGLRFILPIGPLRFDLGRGEKYWIFHFGLGSTF
jgi:outer membrane protein insertion porin family